MSRPAVPPANAGEALNARFRRDVEVALARAVEGRDRLALAVSGGADSMAMLLLAHRSFTGQVIAATVDHRLRPESADEAVMVADWCRAAGIPHATLAPDAPISGASVQARAREVRYALLGAWATQAEATALLTAHHADDQAETFLMRAARGSGVSGLAAIREAREFLPGVALLRPLLDWRRHELRALVEDGAVPFVDDPSNASDAYDRTRFRRMVEANPWLDVSGIARSARHLAEAERALIASADRLWDEVARIEGDAVAIDPRDLSREMLRRLVRTAITLVRGRAGIDAPQWHDAVNIEPLLDALIAGQGATQAGVAGSVRAEAWHFREAPPRRTP